MKVNRINVVINRVENKHIKYLDNQVLDIMRTHKFGGLNTNDRIELHSMPEKLTEELNKLKIKFWRVHDKKEK